MEPIQYYSVGEGMEQWDCNGNSTSSPSYQFHGASITVPVPSVGVDATDGRMHHSSLTENWDDDVEHDNEMNEVCKKLQSFGDGMELECGSGSCEASDPNYSYVYKNALEQESNVYTANTFASMHISQNLDMTDNDSIPPSSPDPWLTSTREESGFESDGNTRSPDVPGPGHYESDYQYKIPAAKRDWFGNLKWHDDWDVGTSTTPKCTKDLGRHTIQVCKRARK